MNELRENLENMASKDMVSLARFAAMAGMIDPDDAGTWKRIQNAAILLSVCKKRRETLAK